MYIYTNNESNYNVYFDEVCILHEKTNSTLQVTQLSDYYPFGLGFNVWNKESIKANRYLYQKQELQDDLGYDEYQYKYRMHDPAMGRFLSVDPLSEKYMYNSPYAFSENKVINGVELEGLEQYSLTEHWSRYSGFGQAGLGMGMGSYLKDLFSNNRRVQNFGMSLLPLDFGRVALKSIFSLPMVDKSLFQVEPITRNEWLGAAKDVATFGPMLFTGPETRMATISEEFMLPSSATFAPKIGLATNKSNNLALGLSDDLFKFAESKGFDTYKNFSTGFQQDKILSAMKTYDQIHFNTTGFGKINFSRFNPDDILTHRNYTNWEMHTVFSNPNLLNKTTFYTRNTEGGYRILESYTPFIK
jgi:RHS repeat-associated protein